MKYFVWGFVALVAIGFCALPAIIPAIVTANASSRVGDPILEPSKLEAFQPDSTFRVVDFETFTGNGLVRAIVQRTDGHQFSAMLIRKPSPYLGDRVVVVGDFVKLAEITYIRNAPPSGHGPIERMLVIHL